MSSVPTTQLSPKGQVVIPEGVRTDLHLVPGTRFAVLGQDDTVILKTIKAPSMQAFDRLVRAARAQARRSGMKRSDIAKAIARARGR
jgi:AbrB family looped-hinge helix DNA binding protein